MEDSIKAALKAAKVKLVTRIKEREKNIAEGVRLDKEIGEWRRVVESLTAVTQNNDADLPDDLHFAGAVTGCVPSVTPSITLKFTDAVREVLRRAENVALSAPQIRDELKTVGFDFSKYAQELVPVHNTLKRLQEQGEVDAVKDAEGQTVGYRWISPVARALVEERSTWLHINEAIARLKEPAESVRKKK